MNGSDDKGSDCDAGQQPDENGKYPFQYSRNAVAIDEQDVEINEDLDHDDGWIEDAICIKKEPERHGERRKAVTNGAIYKGGKQSDAGNNDQRGIKARHRRFLLSSAKWVSTNCPATYSSRLLFPTAFLGLLSMMRL